MEKQLARILSTMKFGEWEKAKAHLQTMLLICQDMGTEQFGQIYKTVNDFIKEVEDEIGLD